MKAPLEFSLLLLVPIQLGACGTLPAQTDQETLRLANAPRADLSVRSDERGFAATHERSVAVAYALERGSGVLACAAGGALHTWTVKSHGIVNIPDPGTAVTCTLVVTSAVGETVTASDSYTPPAYYSAPDNLNS